MSCEKWIIFRLSDLENFSNFLQWFIWQQFSNFILLSWIIDVFIPNFCISELFIKLNLIAQWTNQLFKLSILRITFLVAHKFLSSFFDSLICLFFEIFIYKIFVRSFIRFFLLLWFLFRISVQSETFLLLFFIFTYSWRSMTDKLACSDWRWVTFFKFNFNFTIKSVKWTIMKVLQFSILFFFSECFLIFKSIKLFF